MQLMQQNLKKATKRGDFSKVVGYTISIQINFVFMFLSSV